ncbi:MAG: ATP-binding protein [Dehalococcoidia bacterium]|nr:ATP-binding protein [Dehalococcoidia bacterium]
MKTRFFDLPLRFQIVIPFSLLIVLTAVVVVGFALPLAKKAASENVDLRLDSARSLFLLHLDHETDRLRDSALALSERPDLAAALAANDGAALSHILANGAGSLDALQVLAADGRTLAVGAGRVLSDGDFAGLSGDGTAGIVSSQGGAVLAVAAPVPSTGSPRGYVVAGRLLERLLTELKPSTSVELALYRDGSLLAGTFSNLHGQSTVAPPPPPQPAGDGPVKGGSAVNGRAYAAAYDVVDSLGTESGVTAAVFVPRSDVWPSDMVLGAGIAAALIVPLVLLVLGFATARAIASRLERVVSVIGRIGAGDFGQRVDIDSADEVGRLAQGVNSMAARLQDAEAGKAEFLAMASHEIQTPLTLIHNATEILLDETGKPTEVPRQELLRVIARNIDRMSRRVSDLLDLARMEAGNLTLRRRAIDLRPLIMEVADSVQPMLEGKEQELSLALPSRLPPVNGDPDRVQQVLLNLIANASRHTPEKTHITVRAKNEGESVSVAVEDDGPGIPGERLERLLDGGRRPFARDGHGLGLVIVRRLVDLHGGRVWATSAPGEGTVFTFALPRNGNGKKVTGNENTVGG